jgi:2-oxoglutarate ferredoxin oxidoreductase subunit gamma
MGRMELRLAGSGGQGVILASIILAEAAVNAGKYACQTQSYGPEARGGSCKAEAIVSDTKISYPEVSDPVFVMALTQAAANKYVRNLRDDAIVLLDSGVTLPEGSHKYKVYSLPILETAEHKIGKLMTANIVAVGAINRILKICSFETLTETVRNRVPKGTEELNLRALSAGNDMPLEG